MRRNKLTVYPALSLLLLIVLVILNWLGQAAHSRSLRKKVEEQLKTDEILESKSCRYPGSYCDSCPQCLYSGTLITCKCTYPNGLLGSWIGLDYAKCNGHLENNNGMLYCYPD